MKTRRRISVRNSPIHGKGVFATVTILSGELVCEYKGKRVPREAAMSATPRDVAQPDHTFLFDLGDGHVIDGAVGGNSARWINHSCDPNCVPELDGQKIFIRARRKIDAGEELSIDYALVSDEKMSKALRERYACHCGAQRCRGTMIAGRGSR
ncbi:SET domain-containing protein [Paraburkholderia hospita]|uniref:SET domain-containing protein n=1 Tax=Paraburkholderia hospita TaxID=169430 RepID=UPI000DEFA3AC|nr:SET domain-containing protein [Paraburkholderia hospita]AXF06002.1 SET domain-containing protein-lysine N-methyltransferase [Paraburkholderia hospita]